MVILRRFALEELVKVQLFERCASSSAFGFLTKAVAASPDGKAEFLTEVEDAAQKAEKYEAPHPSWTGPFCEQWLKLAPRLTENARSSSSPWIAHRVRWLYSSSIADHAGHVSLTNAGSVPRRTLLSTMER